MRTKYLLSVCGLAVATAVLLGSLLPRLSAPFQYVDGQPGPTDTRADENSSAAFPIPAVIHQVWLSTENASTPLKWHAAMQSCKQVNAGYTHRLWTSQNSSSLIATHYPQLLQTYHSYRYTIQRADAARYAALLAYGGIYLDLDVECIQPLEAVRQHRLVLAQETAGDARPMMFSNHFLAAEPNSTFMRGMVESLPASNWDLWMLGRHATVFSSTGPWFLSAQAYLFSDRTKMKVLPSSLQNWRPDGAARPLIVHHSDYSWNNTLLAAACMKLMSIASPVTLWVALAVLGYALAVLRRKHVAMSLVAVM